MSPASRFFFSLAAVAALATALPVSAQQSAPGTAAIPRRADGKPDLTGNWDGSGGVLHNSVILEEHSGGFGVQGGKSLIIDPADGKIPYQPWALAERERRREDANAYEDRVGHCEFYDIGRTHQFAKEFLFTGNSFVINEFRHATRIIPLDRKQHLPTAVRRWLGDSIGWWEGDTLVVETTNFYDTYQTRMALGGDFHGTDAKITERFTMKDANTIDWTMTIDDPKTFTRPWTLSTYTPMLRQRGPQGAAPYDSEDTCHEGNVDLVHLKNVYDQAQAQPETK
jgi:hypothetical protein